VLGSAIERQGRCEATVAGGQDSGGALVTVHRADWEKAPKEIQRSIGRKFKYPVFVSRRHWDLRLE